MLEQLTQVLTAAVALATFAQNYQRRRPPPEIETRRSRPMRRRKGAAR